MSDDFSLQNDEQIEQQGGGVETQPVFVLRGCFFGCVPEIPENPEASDVGWAIGRSP